MNVPESDLALLRIGSDLCAALGITRLDECARVANALRAAYHVGCEGPPLIPMRLHCPECGALHIDEGEFAMQPHHTHACQHCGAVWRPAIVHTVGVRFLPGFKNEKTE